MNRVVKIEWIDSSIVSGWHDAENDYANEITRPTSFGTVVFENETAIAIAQNFSQKDEKSTPHISGVIIIPKVSILCIEDVTSF